MHKLIDYLEEGFIAFLLTAMTLVTFSQVVARYVFNSGAVWALELTTYLFAWLVMFGAAYCVKKGVHISIDSFVDLFSKRTRKYITLSAISFCLLYCAILFKGGWDYIAKLKQIGIEAEDMPIEEWKIKIILPVGFALIFFRLLEVAWKVHKGEIETMHFVNETEQLIEEIEQTSK
jgi:C4-dicarboxylate transporter DctQ subunit